MKIPKGNENRRTYIKMIKLEDKYDKQCFTKNYI